MRNTTLGRVVDARRTPASVRVFDIFLPDTVDSLKQELKGNFISIYLDGLDEGYYPLSNGIDIYIEPLDGVVKPMRRKAKTEEERDIEKALGIKETGHGNYILKEGREKIPFSELLKIVKKKVKKGWVLKCTKHEDLKLVGQYVDDAGEYNPSIECAIVFRTKKEAMADFNTNAISEAVEEPIRIKITIEEDTK